MERVGIREGLPELRYPFLQAERQGDQLLLGHLQRARRVRDPSLCLDQ